MAPTPDAFYAAQVRRGEATALLARRQWRTLASVDDFDRIATRLSLTVTSGQLGAAREGVAYASSMLGGLGADVVPSSLAGVASDGRSLARLLYSPVTTARSLYGSGLTDADIMARAEASLLRIVRTQIADAGRDAVGVGIAATEGAGWYRMVSPPCCQDCAVQAGRWFRWNQGFQRHARCDCQHIPARSGEAPPGLLDKVPTSQIKDLTEGQRKALDDGADLSRVVNAYRKAGSRKFRPRMTTTSELAVKGRARLTPDAIYRLSATREEALERLREHGYIR